ncbi:hypothetical protein [Georgenia sp. Z1491]|uniref:hypothetical protein n=1 Tax=Georgenia sp. Z1491 TaxID=3416707 RepID=UPI003CF87F46
MTGLLAPSWPADEEHEMTLEIDPYSTAAVGDDVWVDGMLLRDGAGELPDQGVMDRAVGTGPDRIAGDLSSLRSAIADFLSTHDTGLLALAAATEACGSSTVSVSEGFDEIDHDSGTGFDFLEV